MDFCEAAGLWPMFGLRTDETEQDMADLIDYCLGGPETTWGRHRIADGHPKPYFLKAIQIGNEEPASPDYFTRVKDLGGAIWSKNRDLDVVLSINVGRRGNDEGFADLAHWCQGLGQEKHLVLDSHYLSAISHADTGLAAAAGLELQRKLAMQVPGFNLRLWPMEENGDRCTWERGLAHAHNLNTMNRMPAALERAGVANTFQAWNLALVWDQGRIHFTPSQVFFQPSYYVDRMFADEWLPLVVPVECESKTLDVLAKKSRDGKVLTIYLVNIAEASGSVSLANCYFDRFCRPPRCPNGANHAGGEQWVAVKGSVPLLTSRLQAQTSAGFQWKCSLVLPSGHSRDQASLENQAAIGV